jgi:ABC-2 type transport system permease protein
MNRGAWRAIGLVASREIRVRATSKAFLWTTALLVVGIVAVGFVATTFGSGLAKPVDVGVSRSSASLGPSVEAAAAATGVQVHVTEVDGDGAAAVTAGDVAAGLSVDGATLVVVVQESVPLTLQPVVGLLAQQLALADQVSSLGGDPAQVTAAVAGAAPRIETLSPGGTVDAGQIAAGLFSGVLIFIAIIMSGQLVAVGVVEEKTSRVVELLLATIRPWQLMAGKVLGIGAIGLLQLVAILAAGAGTALATGALAGTSIDVGTIALWVLVWFLIGYVMYALVLAALGALVSRQEDVQTVVTPVILAATIPYMIGVTVAPSDPTSPLVQVLSLIPFSAPFLMPIRMSLGVVAGWEVALSLVLALATIPLLVWFAGTVYRNAVLRTGARVPLREALRG